MAGDATSQGCSPAAAVGDTQATATGAVAVRRAEIRVALFNRPEAPSA